MGESAGKPPAAPDPSTILALQNQYNRNNSVGPFGSQSWSSSGPGGHETLTTNLSPQMQGAMDRAFSAAATPYQKEYIPQGLDQLTSGILGTVGKRYGVTGMDTNLQHQKGQMGSPQPPQGLGSPMGQMQLQGNPGVMQGQMGALGGGMGMPNLGGMSGGIPQGTLGAMSALGGANSPMGMPNLQTQPSPNQMPLGRMGI